MEGVELYLHSSITSALDWVSCQHHAPASLFPGKKAPILIEYDKREESVVNQHN